jgi:two-component system, chemotaxis family, sensor kinase Cph1
VAQEALATPAFGQADLSNCEREQIHLAGSIQPHGVLLVFREPELVVVQASANAAAFLGLTGDLLGQALDAISPDLARRLKPHLSDPLDVLPIPIRCHVGPNWAAFDGLAHRPPGGGLVIELERAGPTVDLDGDVAGALPALVAAASVRALCDETARLFRSLTGYDRVMVYRFDDDGHGEVFSEERRASLEAFLGNRYPASDIPQIARRLYERNRVRVLVDVHYDPVPLAPAVSPLTGGDLDMSLCFMRSMSPIHIQYLKNMGVCATLVVSILVGGRLWGLVSCHHYEPRQVHFEMRAVCELLAEVVGTRIAALESFAQAQADLSVRRLEQRLVEGISRDGDWRAALFEPSQSILKPVGATGAALLMDDQVLTIGEVPGTDQLREIGRWLDGKGLHAAGTASVFATYSLTLDEPAFRPLAGIASGLVATAISNTPGDYLLWFRPEQVRTLTWGGNPFKPVLVGEGDSPSSLSPRRSFSQWHQVVEGTSEPWSKGVLTTARLIGETVSDVVIQFRSVEMLIAQNQLDVVRRQVQRSEHAVVVAGADGRIYMGSQAFEALLSPHHPRLETLDDLPQLFESPTKVRHGLRELMARRQTWRAEAELLGTDGETRPVRVRADPVFSAPERVLGYVLIVTDMVERKAAEAARRRFQEKVVARSRLAPARLDSKADLLHENLLSAIVENAQLAALEITDGVEVGQMPGLLDSVQSSVDRSAELLRHLIRHAVSSTKH